MGLCAFLLQCLSGAGLGAVIDARGQAFGAPQSPPGRRPNVVVILADDLGSVDAGCYGSNDVRTPAIDRLARRGVRFTQFYAPAPVCSPSRAALLTGKSPQAAGVPGNVAPQPGSGLPPQEITLAERLQAAGYRTALVGKWHLGHDADHRPEAQGFQRWFGHLGGCIDNWSHFFYWNGPNRHDLWRHSEKSPAREVFEDGSHFLDLMLREASAVVLDEDERPFFLYWAINAPHYPYQPDSDRLARLRESGVEHPRDLYSAFVESMDARIGAFIDVLDREGLTDSTIVVFQSDHGHSTEVRAHGGGGSAGPYRGAKFSLFEGGLRVPSVIAWPGGLPVGETRHQVASGMDWVPTLLELAGLPAAGEPLSGRSLVPLLRDATAPSPHAELHWQRGSRWAVRAGDWKLLFDPHDTSTTSNPPPWPESEQLWLVDVERDPGERINRAAEHPELVTELTELHAAWVERGHSPARKTRDLRVAAFNLRYAGGSSPHPWSARKHAAAELVRTHAPDVIGTQEGLPNQLEELSELLPAYDRFGLGRDAGGSGEAMAIFYRRDRLTLLEGGHFWLSETPDVAASRSWDSACNRMATWGRFQDRASGRGFFLLNTHFDHVSEQARRQGARLIAERVELLAGELPVILTGDFNARAEDSVAWTTLAGAESPFVDTWGAAEERGPLVATFHGWNEPKPNGARIDWILVDGDWQVKRAWIATDRPRDVWPSDHFPVMAVLRLP